MMISGLTGRTSRGFARRSGVLPAADGAAPSSESCSGGTTDRFGGVPLRGTAGGNLEAGQWAY